MRTTKTRNAHVGDAILNMEDNTNPAGRCGRQTGAYMGVVDGSTPYGDIIGAGPEADFPHAPDGRCRLQSPFAVDQRVHQRRIG